MLPAKIDNNIKQFYYITDNNNNMAFCYKMQNRLSSNTLITDKNNELSRILRTIFSQYMYCIHLDDKPTQSILSNFFSKMGIAFIL